MKTKRAKRTVGADRADEATSRNWNAWKKRMPGSILDKITALVRDRKFLAAFRRFLSDRYSFNAPYTMDSLEDFAREWGTDWQTLSYVCAKEDGIWIVEKPGGSVFDFDQVVPQWAKATWWSDWMPLSRKDLEEKGRPTDPGEFIMWLESEEPKLTGKVEAQVSSRGLKVRVKSTEYPLYYAVMAGRRRESVDEARVKDAMTRALGELDDATGSVDDEAMMALMMRDMKAFLREWGDHLTPRTRNELLSMAEATASGDRLPDMIVRELMTRDWASMDEYLAYQDAALHLGRWPVPSKEGLRRLEPTNPRRWRFSVDDVDDALFQKMDKWIDTLGRGPETGNLPFEGRRRLRERGDEMTIFFRSIDDGEDFEAWLKGEFWDDVGVTGKIEFNTMRLYVDVSQLGAEDLERIRDRAKIRRGVVRESAWRPLAEETERETLDDVFDNIVRKLIVLGSIDALQDVDFDEATGSVYLFMDASMGQEEVHRLQETVAGLYPGSQVVASPDGSLEGEAEPADWWVVFVPRESITGDQGVPDSAMWGMPQAVVPSYAQADAVADVARGVDVQAAVDRVLGEAERNSFAVKIKPQKGTEGALRASVLRADPQASFEYGTPVTVWVRTTLSKGQLEAMPGVVGVAQAGGRSEAYQMKTMFGDRVSPRNIKVGMKVRIMRGSRARETGTVVAWYPADDEEQEQIDVQLPDGKMVYLGFDDVVVGESVTEASKMGSRLYFLVDSLTNVLGEIDISEEEWVSRAASQTGYAPAALRKVYAAFWKIDPRRRFDMGAEPNAWEDWLAGFGIRESLEEAAFKTQMLRDIEAVVAKHATPDQMRQAWAQPTAKLAGKKFFAFNGPDLFTVTVPAKNKHHAKYLGWIAWLKSIGAPEAAQFESVREARRGVPTPLGDLEKGDMFKWHPSSGEPGELDNLYVVYNVGVINTMVKLVPTPEQERLMPFGSIETVPNKFLTLPTGQRATRDALESVREARRGVPTPVGDLEKGDLFRWHPSALEKGEDPERLYVVVEPGPPAVQVTPLGTGMRWPPINTVAAKWLVIPTGQRATREHLPQEAINYADVERSGKFQGLAARVLGAGVARTEQQAKALVTCFVGRALADVDPDVPRPAEVVDNFLSKNEEIIFGFLKGMVEMRGQNGISDDDLRVALKGGAGAALVMAMTPPEAGGADYKGYSFPSEENAQLFYLEIAGSPGGKEWVDKDRVDLDRRSVRVRGWEELDAQTREKIDTRAVDFKAASAMELDAFEGRTVGADSRLREAKEYVLWGLPRGETDHLHDTVLLSNGRSMRDVEKVKKLASKEGWHTFRVQVIDLSRPFDAGAAFRGAVRRESAGRVDELTMGRKIGKWRIAGSFDPVRSRCHNCGGWMTTEPSEEPRPYERCPHCERKVWVVYLDLGAMVVPVNLDPEAPIEPQLAAAARKAGVTEDVTPERGTDVLQDPGDPSQTREIELRGLAVEGAVGKLLAAISAAMGTVLEPVGGVLATPPDFADGTVTVVAYPEGGGDVILITVDEQKAGLYARVKAAVDKSVIGSPLRVASAAPSDGKGHVAAAGYDTSQEE